MFCLQAAASSAGSYSTLFYLLTLKYFGVLIVFTLSEPDILWNEFCKVSKVAGRFLKIRVWYFKTFIVPFLYIC